MSPFLKGELPLCGPGAALGAAPGFHQPEKRWDKGDLGTLGAGSGAGEGGCWEVPGAALLQLRTLHELRRSESPWAQGAEGRPGPLDPLQGCPPSPHHSRPSLLPASEPESPWDSSALKWFLLSLPLPCPGAEGFFSEALNFWVCPKPRKHGRSRQERLSPVPIANSWRGSSGCARSSPCELLSLLS